MPLLKIDLIKGKSPKDIKKILDSLNEAVLTAFEVPQGDRYQIVTQHEPYEMILEDTGLGFQRNAAEQIAITIISRPRTKESKELFYQLVAEKLYQNLQIDSKNILISIIENNDSDWSFGFGRAQFLTGEL
ncbi:tautomerase family protein [Enterococcus sp. HY326]|uniref:tautomerase family protein n=1 Tax=Enterococcus sp. HY326 TaxID=2971265 RepID=UPI002240CA64|nr:tautomerase family protein [Enterococcus sp. HY326]